jgi:ATP-binding cassette subfamily B protein
MKVDSLVDYMTYSDFRTFYDQGSFPLNSGELGLQIHKSSELDRRIVKLGSYSRLTIEFSFIISVILTFLFINVLVPQEARIQFFAVLAYSFFRVIPAFSRIISARNQIASHQTEFLNLMENTLAPDWNEEITERSSFQNSLEFILFKNNADTNYLEISFLTGEFVVIKGDTGVGKTTLLKTVGGLIPAEFRLKIDGKNLACPKEWKPKATLVSQNPFLVGSTLFEMVTGRNSSTDYDSTLYEEALKISGLSAWLSQRSGVISNEHISGGERKQIALARAIYQKPDLLLLDEVTAGMDPQLAEKIISNLLDCEKFKLILMATHDSILESKFSQIIHL